MTEVEFIEDQIEQYGEDYVHELMDKGFVPCYIARKGWTWLMPKLAKVH